MAKNKPACGNRKCSVSTGIHEGLTFGSGRLDHCGFWEFPCALCAREYEKKHPEVGTCWPFVGQDIEAMSKEATKQLDEEEAEFRRYGLL